MRLIDTDKYKKDIEHYRNTICYQRNVTMDDCMRILDKQVDVLDKIRTEIEQRTYGVANDSVIQGMKYERVAILEILDKYTGRK